MKYVKVKKADGEKIRIEIADRIAKGYPIVSDRSFVYLPVSQAKGLKYTIVEKAAKPIEKPTLASLLKGKLTQAQLADIPSGFDTIGTIAILELPEGLSSKGKLIAEAILKLHRNIRTVVAKASEHTGEFRLQSFRHLAGEKTTETIHRENGIQLKLDIARVYFSPRLGTERLRVAKHVKPGEQVLVMFSGCGPYTCVIGKIARPRLIVGIELNPDAHCYAVINKNINHLENVELYGGDVTKVLPSLGQQFDRIVMPLPKTGKDFLDVALKSSKRGTVIHFYDFQKEGDFPEATIEKIKKHCKAFKVLAAVPCGSYSPGVSRVCLDFQVGA